MNKGERIPAVRDKIKIVVFVLFVISSVIVSTFMFLFYTEDNHFQRSCKEAGGIPGKMPHLCLHPSSVIKLKD